MKIFCRYAFVLLISILMKMNSLMAQPELKWNSFPSLPDARGFAGMFTGISHGSLFCMGGANFPDKYPWEGGTKNWDSKIFKLDPGGEWQKLDQSLPSPLGYGVSVSYKNKIYIIGGSNADGHTNNAFSLEWKNEKLEMEAMPAIPYPLANMTGALVNSLIIIAGGSTSPTGPPTSYCLGFDLEDPAKGWFKLPSWPGPERTLPVSAVTQGKFYLFSGEKTGLNAANEKYRYILQDAYVFSPEKKKRKWTGSWKKLAPVPAGASAAGNPLPVLPNGSILIGGGVDVITALHTDPTTHPGITRNIQVYNPGNDSWQIFKNKTSVESRVTLPVIFWQKQWLYISGEVKPGIRTNTILALENK